MSPLYRSLLILSLFASVGLAPTSRCSELPLFDLDRYYNPWRGRQRRWELW